MSGRDGWTTAREARALERRQAAARRRRLAREFVDEARTTLAGVARFIARGRR
jgi:hypothetical protein